MKRHLLLPFAAITRLFSLPLILAVLCLTSCGGQAPVGKVASHDGVEIAYSTAGTGTPALVFVHGWTLDRSYWTEQVRHFSPRFRTVAIDLAGHGQSGMGRDEWTMTAFGQDVASVVDELGIEPTILVGHSMGGAVVLEASQLLGDRVAGIVLVDAFHDPDQPMADEEREGILQAYRSDFRGNVASMVRQYLFAPQTDSVLAHRITEQMSSFDPTIGVASIENLFHYDPREAFSGIAAPMIAINSDLYPTNAESMARYGIGIRTMSGVGHFPMVEKPSEFNELLDAVVAEWD